eukprot:scaffold18539_cov54-Phaeocystis_antarctica.AAC.3
MPRPLHMGIKDLLCAPSSRQHITHLTPPRHLERTFTRYHTAHTARTAPHSTATPHHTSTPRPSRTPCEPTILVPPSLAPRTPPPPHAHSRPQPISPPCRTAATRRAARRRRSQTCMPVRTHGHTKSLTQAPA